MAGGRLATGSPAGALAEAPAEAPAEAAGRRCGRRLGRGGRGSRRAARRRRLDPAAGCRGEERTEPDGDDRERATDHETPSRDPGRGRRGYGCGGGEQGGRRQVGRRLATGLDRERVGRRPDQPDLLARLPELGARGALDVLLVDRDRPATAGLDDVAGRDAEVRHVADRAEQLVRAVRDRVVQLEQPDLLRAYADLVLGQPLGQRRRDTDGGPVGEPRDGEVALGAVGLGREQVADAQEPGDEPRPGSLVQAGRIGQLLVATVVHDGDAIGHRHRFFLVVGHEDERDPDLLLDPFQLDLHLLAQLQVECAERLVEQEDGRPVDERPGERDPLGLPTRDLGRLAALEARQFDELEHVGDALLDLGVVDVGAAKTERDVLVDRQVREEGVVLEDRVDVPLVGRQPGDVLALELDEARCRGLEPADHPEGGRLAAAGRSEEREELAGLDLEVDVIDDHGLAVALDDIYQLDVDRGHGRSVSCGDEAQGRTGARLGPGEDMVAWHGCQGHEPQPCCHRTLRDSWPVAHETTESVESRHQCEDRHVPPRGRGTISTQPPSEHGDHVRRLKGPTVDAQPDP